ncbi:hypothetical protein [Haloferax gibbonsii]|uniref:hypothetical protein n=1 Tax=Haloferax gibbonsii TaxID=35746 RepID=UPI001FD4753B|nr:hypothetical protein [Haloferax gibbonsii]
MPDDAGYTYTQANGNPHVERLGDITDATVVDIDLPGTPVWIAGTSIDFGASAIRSQWAVVLQNGRVHAFYITDEGVESAELGPDRIDGPPAVSSDAPRLLTHPDSSPYTNPLPYLGQLVTVGTDGALTFQPAPGEYDMVHTQDFDLPRRTFEVDAPPDARIVAGFDTVYVFADATDEYDHGALGDSLEGGSVVAIHTSDEWSVSRFSPPDGAVFEATTPIITWFDRDAAQIVTTASDAETGARVVAIDTETGEVRSGPPLGTGFRWRHTLAVDSFGPNGEQEIAAVRTPHVGGVAEFYRPTDDALELVATDDGGYRSHVLGSRNLDGGLSGYFAGEDQTVLAVPTRDRTELAFLRRVEGGIQRHTTIPIGGELTTNLAGASEDGTIAAGSEGRVRFWIG